MNQFNGTTLESEQENPSVYLGFTSFSNKLSIKAFPRYFSPPSCFLRGTMTIQTMAGVVLINFHVVVVNFLSLNLLLLWWQELNKGFSMRDQRKSNQETVFFRRKGINVTNELNPANADICSVMHFPHSSSSSSTTKDKWMKASWTSGIQWARIRRKDVLFVHSI